MDKVNEEVRHHVSLIVQRDLDDPKIGFVTITRVEVSSDLRVAHIYFTTLAEDESFDDTLEGLNKSAGVVRNLLGRRIRMKFTPEIRFINDNSEKESSRIDQIIEKLHR